MGCTDTMLGKPAMDGQKQSGWYVGVSSTQPHSKPLAFWREAGTTTLPTGCFRLLAGPFPTQVEAERKAFDMRLEETRKAMGVPAPAASPAESDDDDEKAPGSPLPPPKRHPMTIADYLVWRGTMAEFLGFYNRNGLDVPKELRSWLECREAKLNARVMSALRRATPRPYALVMHGDEGYLFACGPIVQGIDPSAAKGSTTPAMVAVPTAVLEAARVKLPD